MLRLIYRHSRSLMPLLTSIVRKLTKKLMFEYQLLQKLSEQVNSTDKENEQQRLVNTIISNNIGLKDQSKEKTVPLATSY